MTAARTKGVPMGSNSASKRRSGKPDACYDLEYCQKCSEKILTWTILSNVLMTVITFTGGFLSGSVGLMADGTHSICCMIASCVIAYSVKFSKKESDGQFPFGYGKLELVVSLSVYSMLFGLGIFVSISSIANMITNSGHGPSLIGLPIAFTAVLIAYMQYRYNNCAGKKLKSWSIIANAQNSKADMLTTSAVSIGIIFSQFGPSFAIFDSIAALVVGIVILKDAVGLWLSDFKMILDQLPEPGFREKVVAAVSEVFPGSVKLLKPKRIGRKFWIGLSLQMSEDATIGDWEAVQKKIEEHLRKKIDGIGEVDFFLASA